MRPELQNDLCVLLIVVLLTLSPFALPLYTGQVVLQCGDFDNQVLPNQEACLAAATERPHVGGVVCTCGPANPNAQLYLGAITLVGIAIAGSFALRGARTTRLKRLNLGIALGAFGQWWVLVSASAWTVILFIFAPVVALGYCAVATICYVVASRLCNKYVP